MREEMFCTIAGAMLRVVRKRKSVGSRTLNRSWSSSGLMSGGEMHRGRGKRRETQWYASRRRGCSQPHVSTLRGLGKYDVRMVRRLASGGRHATSTGSMRASSSEVAGRLQGSQINGSSGKAGPKVVTQFEERDVTEGRTKKLPRGGKS